ncbi:MAG: hypothetical protein JSV09_08415 [Thermoplasmata archaeon]|nr:MAG: hypothetical protein JSV09_08415 [Thermoplasmata archaeon]
MPVRKMFERDKLIKALDDISKHLKKPIKAFLVGGLSMIFHGAKLATKDIDIVFSNQKDAQAFIEAAKEIGFSEASNLGNEYIDLKARCVLEGKDEIRFDIFIEKVCNALSFSKGMKERAQKMYERDTLKLYVASVEDIFLFKAITSRPDDLADMATLAGKEIRWKIVEEEARSQYESWKWIGRLYGRLEELEEEFGIPSPLKSRIREEAEIAQAVDILAGRLKSGSISLESAAEALKEEDYDFVKKVIKEMNRLKMVEEKDDLIYLSK